MRLSESRHLGSTPSPAAMIKKSKIIVVLPAFNAEKTLEKTVSKIPKDIVSEIILVDDGSNDDTVALAKKL